MRPKVRFKVAWEKVGYRDDPILNITRASRRTCFQYGTSYFSMNERKWHQCANTYNVNGYESSYQSVGRSVGPLVDTHNFLKGWEVKLPCSYRSIRARRMFVWLVGQTICRSVINF